MERLTSPSEGGKQEANSIKDPLELADELAEWGRILELKSELGLNSPERRQALEAYCERLERFPQAVGAYLFENRAKGVDLLKLLTAVSSVLTGVEKVKEESNRGPGDLFKPEELKLIELARSLIEEQGQADTYPGSRRVAQKMEELFKQTIEPIRQRLVPEEVSPETSPEK